MLRFVLEGLVYCKEDIEEYLNKASEKFKEVLDFATEIKKILVEKGIPNKDYIIEALLSTYYLYGFKTTLNALMLTKEMVKKGVSGCYQRILHPWVSSDSGLHLLDPVHRAPSHGTSQTTFKT